MGVTRVDVERVAELAALKLDEAALDGFTREIAAIVDYVSQLEAVQGAAPTGETTMIQHPQPLRPDEVRPADLAFPVAALAPAFRDGLFLVPRLASLDAGDDGAPEE